MTSITLLYFIKALILPPLSFITLAIFGFLYRHSCWGLKITGVSLSALLLLSLSVVVDMWARAWEIYPPLQAQAILAFKPEAVIVIGSGATAAAAEYQKTQTVNVRSLLRIRYAAKLAKQWSLPVLVSGGSLLTDERQAPEAVLMAELLTEEFGVPVVLQETQSRNTAENARFSQALLQKYAISKILLVTQAYHMPRAANEFRRAGFDVLPAPAAFIHEQASLNLFNFLPSTTALMNSFLLAYEGLGMFWYYIRAES